MSETPASILLIDDHPLLRQGIKQLISMEQDMEVVGEASNAADGIRMATEIEPDLILMDLNMPEMDGIEALKRLRAQNISSRIIMFTVSDHEEDVVDALRAGADGYLLKDMEPEDLRSNLVKAALGVTVLQDSLTEVLKKALIDPDTKTSASDVSLTDRETEILDCLAEGMNNKNIARKLGISDTTVKVHIKNILRKLNLTSRLEAAVWRHQNR